MIDAVTFRWFKKRSGEGKIWLRATGSTAVSQFVDSFIVLYIAFVLGPQQWRTVFQRVTPLDAALTSLGLNDAGGAHAGVRLRRHLSGAFGIEAGFRRGIGLAILPFPQEGIRVPGMKGACANRQDHYGKQ